MAQSVKYCFTLLIALLFSGIVFSQKHTNIWYFGKGSGLNFNQNPPQVLHNGVASSIEGSATISDNNGDLLFYTNGKNIINKNQLPMVNGNFLLGNVSSTCNTVIVPLPDSNQLYYLFTVGAAGYDDEGLRYNVIDMKRQNGLGEVIQKNVLLEDKAYEKLAAVRHCNKKNVWIVVRQWETDEYHSYLVTSSGISAPVISHTGFIVGGYSNNSLGTLKFSPDGSKLAAVHSFDNDRVELMDFNNTTGVISNPVYFTPNTTPPASSFMGVYGAEFSPNGRLLYISANNSTAATAVLYQFDITTMNGSAILATKQLLSQTTPWIGGALQVGPDLKIYYTMWKDSSLSVIENPDVYGSGSNFQYNKIYFGPPNGEPLQYGLPVFIAGDMDERYTPFDFSSVNDCTTFDVSFTMNKTTGVDSVRWDFGDGFQSTALSPVHHYASAGNYQVALTIYKIDCSGNFEIINHPVTLGLPSGNNFLPGDTSFCEIKDFIISTAIPAQSYLWNTGATGTAITVNDPGEYWLEVVKDGCAVRDSFRIGLKSPISVNIGRDTTVCVTRPVVVDAMVTAAYIWNTGSLNRTIEITRPGLYWVKVTNADGCSDADSLVVTWGDCDVFIPSAFSPNGDGHNDEFSLSNGINTESFNMNIYNRYGQVVFNSRDPMNKWNGKFKGKDLPMGLYPWVIIYKKNSFTYTDKGTVLLIR